MAKERIESDLLTAQGCVDDPDSICNERPALVTDACSTEMRERGGRRREKERRE